MQTYVVQMGDTLYGISKQFGITVEELRLENDLTNNTLRIGQILRIPTVETTSLYVVKKGDTLYSIASRYDVSVNALISLNNSIITLKIYFNSFFDSNFNKLWVLLLFLSSDF